MSGCADKSTCYPCPSYRASRGYEFGTYLQLNTRPATNPPMKLKTRRMLAEESASEIEWPSRHIDRDLSHWLKIDG